MLSALWNGPTDFPCARSQRADSIDFLSLADGSKTENETVLLRAKFFSDALIIADKENPSSSATFCASFFTLGSILMLSTAVFIYDKVYTLSLLLSIAITSTLTPLQRVF